LLTDKLSFCSELLNTGVVLFPQTQTDHEFHQVSIRPAAADQYNL